VEYCSFAAFGENLNADVMNQGERNVTATDHAIFDSHIPENRLRIGGWINSRGFLRKLGGIYGAPVNRRCAGANTEKCEQNCTQNDSLLLSHQYI